MRIVFVAAILSIMSSLPALAEVKLTSDEFARATIRGALKNIHRLRCGTQACAQTTDAEIKNPPVTLAEAKSVILRGVASYAGEHCGLDWRKRSFDPMLAHWRIAKQKNARQVALITIMHHTLQDMGRKAFVGKPCTADLRRSAEADLNFRP